MSGGSRDYKSYVIDEYYVDRMYDKELDDMMRDIANLCHDVEWYESGDTSYSTYMESVKAFKKKWFKGSRDERLKGYVDEGIEKLRRELYECIDGIEFDD